MATPASPLLQKTFPLDPEIVGPGSSLDLQVGASTDADVLQAIAANQPFPARPGGVIDLAHISLVASGGNPVAFTGGGTTVGFSFSAGVTAGLGIFDDPEAAMSSLNLGETPGLDLSIGAEANSRYALLRAGYQASGSVSGSHPIGTFGSFTFGAAAAADGVSAVLHRFVATTGSDIALEDTIASWKFPRHITSADKLKPATWIVTEADGSLSVKLAASLGYNFNFVKDVQAFGLSGDIGLKIDAAATATFGFDVSGRYVLVVGRESADPKLRLRVFKLKSNGLQFGLNLKLGVTGVETLTPNSVDDFVAAVFGVHAAQIVTALQQIDKWTDPSKSVGQLVAGLANDKALALIQEVTGIDPKAAFDAARAKLLDAINLYQALPQKVSSELLGLINKLDPAASTELQNSLSLLASTDPSTQLSALNGLLADVGVTNSPIGKILDGLADNGLLDLLNKLPQVQKVANGVLSILNGGVIAKLQGFISDKLDLNKVLNVVDQTSFDQLDSFLVGRLSIFFDQALHFADLNTVRNAINMVVSKRQEIYTKAVAALNSRYGAELAATWASTSSNTAVVDAVFDMTDTNSASSSLFKDLVTVSNSALDRLVANQVPGVQLNAAVLSHELQRKSTLEISLPHFNFQTQNVVTALASVHPQDDAGRILLFDASGTDVVSVRNKFSSSLSITVAAAIGRMGSAANTPDLRIHSTDGNTWSYELLYAKAAMKREELEAITRPFITQFMADQFSQGTSLSSFYNQLESTSEKILSNGPEVFGDLCASFEVILPGETISAWTLPITNVPAIARAISVAIQASLKDKLPFFYLSDISKLGNLASSGPLLAWASIPPATAFDGNTFNSDSGKDVFWDHVNVTLRKAAAIDSSTQANLRTKLADYRLRLHEAGLDNIVQFYQDNQAATILNSATTQFGDILFSSLLNFESQIVEKANSALNDVQKFVAVAGTSPTKAVVRLAQFAADITTAFDQLLGQSVFADQASFRAVGQVVFAEASRAINPGVAGPPRAMLTINILNAGRTPDLAGFLSGTLLASGNIAVAQRLVSL
jgi:hypothetical protein